MPVIPQPAEHLTTVLAAIAEHTAHHEQRIAHHQAEIDALHELRGLYEDALGRVTPRAPESVEADASEPAPDASLDVIEAALTGRIPLPPHPVQP